MQADDPDVDRSLRSSVSQSDDLDGLIEDWWLT